MARMGGFSGNNSRVILNVYDLNESNDIYYPWGLGLYHSGVQIGRDEYTFGRGDFLYMYLYSSADPINSSLFFRKNITF